MGVTAANRSARGHRKPKRPVTKCPVCGAKFTASRRDAKYCSARCRQSACRARAIGEDELARQIDETRSLYWQLIQQYAEAKGVHWQHVLTELSPTVTEDGEVYIRGEFRGWCKPQRPGWNAWGLEAAPPPFQVPTKWVDEEMGRKGIDRAARKLAGKPPGTVISPHGS